MTRFGALVERVDKRIPGAQLPLLSVSQTRGVIRRSELTDSPARAESLDHYKTCRAGDIVFNKMSIRAGAMGVAREPGLVTYHYEVMRPRVGTDSRYVVYLMKSDAFTAEMVRRERGIGAGGDSGAVRTTEVPFRVLRTIDTYVPPSAEQRAIADYLDRETAQIEAFIAKSEELIALLAERRAAIAQIRVEHHVNVGTRLKHRVREVDTRAGSGWEKLPLLSVSIHHGVLPREDDSGSSDEPNDLSHYKVARAGDIILNRMRAFQGGLGVAPCAGIVSPDYAVLQPDDGLDADWLALVMRTPRFVGEMAMRLRGIGSTDSGAVRTPRIGVADLGAILVDVPAVAVQRTELQKVTGSVARIEAALEVAQRSVYLARERRAALISAAVTGKIDVGELT